MAKKEEKTLSVFDVIKKAGAILDELEDGRFEISLKVDDEKVSLGKYALTDKSKEAVGTIKAIISAAKILHKVK